MMPCVREAAILGTSPLAEQPCSEHPVAALARRRLRRSAYAEIRHVRCEFDSGVLTLRGLVSSYYLKQVAQVLVQRLEGVATIENYLDVAY